MTAATASSTAASQPQAQPPSQTAAPASPGAASSAQANARRPDAGATFSGRTLEDSTNSTLNARRAAASLTPPHVTQEAQLTKRVAPEYPESAFRKGIEGSVEVSFTITNQGAVTNVSVVSADPPEVFDRAAIEAVRRWRYEPKFVDGQPVESPSQVHLQFKLNSKQAH